MDIAGAKLFGTLKQVLVTAPVLACRYFQKPFLGATDASSSVLGAVLSQSDENTRENPIEYVSRILNEAEKNYFMYGREGLAIVSALKKFRHYPLCQKFKPFTNHEALKYTSNNMDLHRRIARWVSISIEDDFEVMYCPGPQKGKAD